MASWARRADLGLVFLFGFLIWLLNHPYQGVWHDAQIYGLLAAHWLNPEALAGDLFFRFGSQGAFSLFTPLFGELVGWLGLSQAAWCVVIVGGLLWIGACVALAKTMLGTGFAGRFALVLGAVALISYSPNSTTFVLGENFATARLWAIPLGLASVAALAARRTGSSLGLSLLAMALHPLHGIWPLALWLLARIRTPLAVCLALLPIVVAVLLGVANLDLPRVRLMAGDWLDAALRATSDVVFASPLQSRLPEYSGVLIALWLGARQGSQEWSALYLRSLLLGTGGLGLALVASYLFPVEIVMQGQPWRVMALLLPLAAVALVDLGRRAWRSSIAGRFLVGIVGVMASTGSKGLLVTLGGLGLASMMPWTLIGSVEAWASRRPRWLGFVLAILALSILPNVLADWDMVGRKMLNPWWPGVEWLHGLVAGSNWHLAALLALIPWWNTGENSASVVQQPLRSWVVTAVVALLALATMTTLRNWDRRPEHLQRVEACYLDARCPPHPFRQWIVPGSTVYWPRHELAVWFELGTASYTGELQATGRVLSAAKFYEWRRRQAWVASTTDPRHLCADPILDWVVLREPAPGVPEEGAWRGAHLYSCTKLRAVPPTPTISRHGNDH